MTLLLEQFPVTLPDGTFWTGSLYATDRVPSGRRIKVRDGHRVLFDSDDCYDLGNATNKLGLWLATEINRINRENLDGSR